MSFMSLRGKLLRVEIVVMNLASSTYNLSRKIILNDKIFKTTYRYSKYNNISLIDHDMIYMDTFSSLYYMNHSSFVRGMDGTLI